MTNKGFKILVDYLNKELGKNDTINSVEWWETCGDYATFKTLIYISVLDKNTSIFYKVYKNNKIEKV